MVCPAFACNAFQDSATKFYQNTSAFVEGFRSHHISCWAKEQNDIHAAFPSAMYVSYKYWTDIGLKSALPHFYCSCDITLLGSFQKAELLLDKNPRVRVLGLDFSRRLFATWQHGSYMCFRGWSFAIGEDPPEMLNQLHNIWCAATVCKNQYAAPMVFLTPWICNIWKLSEQHSMCTRLLMCAQHSTFARQLDWSNQIDAEHLT